MRPLKTAAQFPRYNVGGLGFRGVDRDGCHGSDGRGIGCNPGPHGSVEAAAEGDAAIVEKGWDIVARLS
jgi:hypothetical protein